MNPANVPAATPGSLAFGYHSPRAQKARFARKVDVPAVKLGLSLLSFFLVLGGLVMVGAGMAAGWLLLGLSSPFIMLLLWIMWELHSIPPNANSRSIDALLDSRLLGALPKEFSPAELAQAALRVPEGIFLPARFGITGEFIASIIVDDPVLMPHIWQTAEQLRQQFGQDHYSVVLVLAAIITSLPNVDQSLAQMEIDSNDIIAGVAWYHHLDELQAEHRRRKNDGGLGRDWSFGYTPLLSQFGTNISDQVTYQGLLTRDIALHKDIVDRILTLFSQGGRQNAALIGKLGTGKTTLVHMLAKRLLEGDADVPRGLRYQQVFALDPSALISSAHGRGELEGLVQHLFYEAYAAKNIILFLDDAHLFFEDGTGSVDLSNVLLPVLDGGGLRLILAMDEQNWLRISQTNPALAQHINRVSVAPTNQAETMMIIEDQLVLMEYHHHVTYMYQALQEAYRLADRYMQDQAMPGKALMLLESAASFAHGGALVTKDDVRTAIEQSIGVKVGTANTGDERAKLLGLEDLIHQRMINQVRAVKVVSDALRRARAGVRNQDRPIGTFLFLGPTGVGKTELSKALAAVYFGGEEHLVRLDLNEYVQPGDVNRLIADAATDPHSLTAQIARQPFSVVLLDEIEKAHPNVLNTLLQLLDEGILRDINNREVSFRDAIIIATSNAGADRIRQYIDAGWRMEDFEQRFTDELISSNQFRPEFLNRFDEIVLFRPLKPEELLQVIDLILAGVNKTLVPQKVSVAVDNDAKKLLVDSGYDPRMGARPMRRIVQRVVENIVAQRMLGGEVAPGEQIKITLADVQAAVSKSRD